MIVYFTDSFVYGDELLEIVGKVNLEEKTVKVKIINLEGEDVFSPELLRYYITNVAKPKLKEIAKLFLKK